MNAPSTQEAGAQIDMLCGSSVDIDIDWHGVRGEAYLSGDSWLIVAQRLTGQPSLLLVHHLASALGWPVMNLSALAVMAPVFDRVPLVEAMQRAAFLARHADGTLYAVVSDPFNVDQHTWLRSRAGESIRFSLACLEDIQTCLHRCEENIRTVETVRRVDAGVDQSADGLEILSLAQLDAAESVAVRLVRSTLYDALKAGASDIHLETTAQGLAVKYRLDGVLEQVATVDGVTLAQQAISRLKVLASLDIAERRVPQDGSFRARGMHGDVDLRLSVMPSVHGEDAVMRILDKRSLWGEGSAPSLSALGFDSESRQTLRQLIEAPHGLLLVTGPTGSGKTTTLYAALSELHNGRSKVITIEDPVEYQLPGILQIPVHDKKGLSFARGLRSILRHDPDIIMVGEIRDRETAEIAVQAALTGHLVLSTVHANSVFDVFGRFSHMGLDPYAFASALDGLWAQRLVRLNCPDCSRPVSVSNAELSRLLGDSTMPTDAQFRAGSGCAMCRGTGYRGRRSIAEVLKLNDTLREMVVRRESTVELRRTAQQAGLKSLREVATLMALRGETTIEEVRRVTHDA